MRERGFTFIEILIATIIFSVGLLGMIGLQGVSFMATDYSGMAGSARMLAIDQVERLGALSYTASPSLDVCGTGYCHKDSGQGVPGTTANLDFTGSASAQGRFRRFWDVQEASATGFTPAIKTIRVRIQWTDVPGVTDAPANSFNRRLEVSTQKVDL